MVSGLFAFYWEWIFLRAPSGCGAFYVRRCASRKLLRFACQFQIKPERFRYANDFLGAGVEGGTGETVVLVHGGGTGSTEDAAYLAKQIAARHSQSSTSWSS